MVFLALRREPGVYTRVTPGWPFKARVGSARSGLLSSSEGHRGILLDARQGNGDASRGEVGDQVSLSSCHSDIGIPINFQEKSGIVSF